MSIGTSLRLYIEDLFSKNTDYKYPEQAINQAESLKSLSNDLYTDNIRFIYELIQNADDAQAINIIITILDNKYLIIAHDGKIFNEKDLQGLCGVNNGTKKKDLDKTGYKGLGFKAVFGKSDQVIIYSNREYFRFDSTYKIKWNKQWGTNDQQTWEKDNDRQFIYPWQINPIWTNENEVPSSIRNFLSSKKIHVANIILLNHHKEIYSAINQLIQQPYMFLFLRHISEMTFFTQTISIARDLNYGIKKVYVNQEMVSQWIIKRYELDVPDDIRSKLIQDSKAPEKLRLIKKTEIFFAAKYNDENIIEKLKDKEAHLFSYLPTKIFDYIFPIIINANFLTNANREQIHTDSTWNKWLFGNIGIKIFQWIKELVINDQFYFHAYKLIPIRMSLIDNNLSREFNQAFDFSIQNCNFIRNRNNQLLKVNEVIMDSTLMSQQSSFINIDSMREYYTENHFQCAEHPFIDYDSNLYRIGVRNFTWKNCIEMFKSDRFLKTYSIEKNKRMIEYFYSNQMEISIEKIPFLMDQNNRLQLTKDIYFPAETIGDSGTTDSDDLFVNKEIFDWLNEDKQIKIKKWLQDLGVTEKTDLTYFHKTIIPNASTYITSENALKTIKMLFILFQSHHIEKKDLNQLKKLKLLTTRGTLIPAEECFFSNRYNPRFQFEEYLKTTEDKFLSHDYLTNDISEWYRFFMAIGVHDEIHLIHYKEKISIHDAVKHGFSQEYLSRPSPNGRRPADGYSGLKIITFLKNTPDNFEFAQVFWSFVIETMKPNDFEQFSTRVYWRSSCGTEIPSVDYIEWFVKHNPCIPTTLEKCRLSINTFMNTEEIRELCGKYMPIVNISSKQNLSAWNSFFNFKTKFLLNDYLQLLNLIREDDKNLLNNQDRIQNIYLHLLSECQFWSINEQELIKTRSQQTYLLTENNQWKLANEIYIYIDGNGINDQIPCLKLEFKNKIHPDLPKFAEFFDIKQIQLNDLELISNESDHAEQFQMKLIEILPYLKNLLKFLHFPIDVISSIDEIIQEKIEFIESESLKLFYNENFLQETNAYFDTIHQQFYLTRPWYSETTMIDLPHQLCQLLNIQGFKDGFRFLLKAEREEILTRFTKLSIEIPVKSISNQGEQTSEEEEEEFESYIYESQQTNDTNKLKVRTKHRHIGSSDSNKRKKRQLSISTDSIDEIFSHFDVIDLSTIPTSFNIDATDRETGLIGEKFVYEYLKDKYSSHSDSITIQWLNENEESYLPYDILLVQNRIKHYIEVKATRSNDKHTFFISLNQIRSILKHGDQYHIYRVYLRQKQLIILNDIETRLKDENQLALLLSMIPKSLDQTIDTNE